MRGETIKNQGLDLINEPLLREDAAWKRRFRIPRIRVQVAHGNPAHALVVSNEFGMYDARASPINYIERIAAPLLIIQGRNDVHNPPRQVEIYEAKARSLRKNVRVVWYESGHAGSGIDVELAITHQEIMLRWIYDVLAKRQR